MLRDERHRRILARVRQKGIVSLSEMADELLTSKVTIRRDLQVLDERGLIRRTRGGAAYPRFYGEEVTYDERAASASREKQAIASVAADLVGDNEVIGMAAGSTIESLARCLVERRNLTVVTNSLLVVPVLAPRAGMSVLLTGGSVRTSTHSLIGAIAEGALARLHLSTVFLSGDGLTVPRGLSSSFLGSASAERAFTSIADRRVVLADHTKLGRERMVQTLQTSEIDHLVTDWGAPEDFVGELRSRGVTVTVAPESATWDSSPPRV